MQTLLFSILCMALLLLLFWAMDHLDDVDDE